MRGKNKHRKKLKLLATLIIFILIGFVIYFTRSYFFKADIIVFVPENPNNLIAKDSSDKTQITLNWTDNASNETGFTLERTPNFEQDFQEIATLLPNILTYADNIEAGKRYYYRVKALGPIGASTYSNIATPTRIENKDLLLSHGNFETSNQTQWGYTDVGGNWQSGINPPTPDDSVANDWMRINAAGLTSGTNFTYQLNSADDFDGNSQIMTLKNWSNGYTYIGLHYDFAVDNSDPFAVHTGDTINVGFDKIAMDQYDTLPKNTTINYFMNISSKDKDGNYQGNNFDQNLTPSKNPNPSYNNQLTVLPNHTSVKVFINMQVNGDIGNFQPSLRVDDAHLYVKRAGNNSYETLEIPVPRDRNINTQRVFYNSSGENPYENAKNFDAVSSSAASYDQLKVMKYYNPNIKIIGYTASTFADARSATYVDPPISYTPIPFGWALEQQKNLATNDWFYKYPPDVGPLESVGDLRSTIDPYGSRLYENDGVTPIPYVFFPEYQDRYPANLDSPSYREAWLDYVIKIYSENKFDGMFLDDTVPISTDGTRTDPITGVKSTVNIVNISDAQIQSFVNYVVPKIHEKLPNLEIVHNAASQHYDDKVAGTYGWPGKTFLNPIWDPTKEIPGVNGAPGVNGVPANFNAADYNKNTFDTTSNTFFQEYAYLNLDWVTGNMSNRYNLHTWVMSIDDIDVIARINSQTSDETQKKRIYQSLEIMDRPDVGNYVNNFVPSDQLSDLSKYDTGWTPFAFSSYLLNNNQYSFLGVMKGDGQAPVYKDPKVVDPGWALTTKLGNSVSDRKIIYGNTEYNFDDPVFDSDTKKILQYRKFQNGFVVVNGSPDENRTYQLDDNYKDELGRIYSKDSVLTLLPHTGRVFFTYIVPPEPDDPPPVDPPPVVPPPVVPPVDTPPVTPPSVPSNETPATTSDSTTPAPTVVSTPEAELPTISPVPMLPLPTSTKAIKKSSPPPVSIAQTVSEAETSEITPQVVSEPTLSSQIRITSSSLKSFWLKNESFTLKNIGSSLINTSGWVIKNSKNQSSNLPYHNLKPGESVTIHSSTAPVIICRVKLSFKDNGKWHIKLTKTCPTRPADQIYLGRKSKFWNRKHDTIQLQSSLGEIIFTKKY